VKEAATALLNSLTRNGRLPHNDQTVAAVADAIRTAVSRDAKAAKALQAWAKEHSAVVRAISGSGSLYQAQKAWFKQFRVFKDDFGPYRMITVQTNNGATVTVKISGKLTGSATDEHYSEMLNKAIELARTGNYNEIHFQHAWKTVAGKTVPGMEKAAGELP